MYGPPRRINSSGRTSIESSTLLNVHRWIVRPARQLGLCGACQALNGRAADTAPHSMLVFVGVASHRKYGVLLGDIERYKCSACSINWRRDFHPKKSKATWQVMAARKRS